MASFSFIDSVSEVKRNESLTAFFTLKGSEEFLEDHFVGFPVMPGVLLLESLKQTAAMLLASSSNANGGVLYRLTEVDEAKFGQFVRPGSQLKLFVKLVPDKKNIAAKFEGRIDFMQNKVQAGKAFSAVFSLKAG